MEGFSNNTPHFFQPLIPDFQSNFSIPKAFLNKYLDKEDVDGKIATIISSKKTDKIWKVKMGFNDEDDNKLYFKNGWKKFCEDYGLQLGDFLVFMLHQNLVFDVFVFDPSSCERPFPGDHHHHPTNSSTEKVQEEEDSSIKGGSSILKSPSYPWCRVVVQTHCFRSAMIHLPREFTEKNGLSRRWCDMELIDEKGHSWSMLLRYYRKRNNGCSYIGGWTKFHTANHLQIGDALIFQLINSGLKPIIKCIRVNDDE